MSLNLTNMLLIRKPGKSGNCIATIAIGESYFVAWRQYCYPTWIKYCEIHDLGLIVIVKDIIDKENRLWKKATWQKMLLASVIKQDIPDVVNVCYLDSDFMINYYAPNIFNFYNPETIGLVSQIKDLPYDQNEIKRRIAFFRHHSYDKKYPLDSALFMDLEQIFSYHNLPVQENYACAGLIIFNIKRHSEIMKSWFEKYDKNVHSITGGGDECHFNYEVQNWGKITWLEYRYQAIWTYEMAWKYPFLYGLGSKFSGQITKDCIDASLFSNYFLHFAGSWYESDMCKTLNVFEHSFLANNLEEYYKYLQIPVTGTPVGVIKPDK